MRLFEKVKALLLLPTSRRHLCQIMQQLEHHSYDELINHNCGAKNSPVEINTVVKAYFWASRTIKKCHCLPRSIALYQKLNSLGYAVEHKFGVNTQDQSLAAHAWVEYQNKPLNESPDLKLKFKVLEKI